MPEAGGTPRNKKKNKGSAKALDEDDANHDASFKKQAEQSPNSHFIEEEATREKHDTMTDENKGHTKDTPITHPNDDRQIYTEDGGNAVHRMPGSPQDALQAKERFDALVRDRDSLRAEVIDMRKTLEGIQLKHRADMEALQQKVDDTESKKEHAESQFQKLLERVNTIKSQLGERLKEDAEELTQAKARIEELEGRNLTLEEDLRTKCLKLEGLEDENEHKSREITTLRDRASLSQQNWLKEKGELLEQDSYLQSEFEQAKEAMHNWEILAMEERSIRENLGEKIVDLEEQLSSLKDAYDSTSTERDAQSATVDGLQRALQDIQTARKQELRQIVETSDAQLEELRQALYRAEKKSSSAEKALQDAQMELERVRPFEKEVKEKNLLIGKLRHEAVTLNDHLTKALRFLKRGKPEDNVDRHIVTNHLLHFLALERSDPKKFQILQLIASLLGWTDEQREQAGLARPGASSTSKLRIPSTPVHRTPSTPTLATEFLDNGNSSKESLAELWSNFLEQESQATSEDVQSKP